MSRTPPAYFEEIRSKAENRWLQLDADPELAGPWHQLFKQVQSPRHVLSELLQNADDAGATQASAEILDDHFVFSHNGEDFKTEHFASLCRFAYSNKRSLHTIGFRGIGFKSIFSLGSSVELFTPTLSVIFNKDRFTLPHWTDIDEEDDGRTRIRVRIDDQNRRTDLEKNLNEWRSSPVSLLFFQNIRQLVIEGVNLAWNSAGDGPIANSEWYELEHDKKSRLLLIRSEYEPFPDDALEEIRQERNVSDDKEFSFPPSQVEIVLGADPGIYVVLPTGVRPELPFACNAPFMQDPARVKIKDPQTSPTNRWLLTRVGRLAAKSMYKWFSNRELDIPERARAYELLVNPSRLRPLKWCNSPGTSTPA
jgi:hypothetical protein